MLKQFFDSLLPVAGKSFRNELLHESDRARVARNLPGLRTWPGGRLAEKVVHGNCGDLVRRILATQSE